MHDDLSQWRPACRSRDVRRPFSTRSGDTELVLFRTASGQVAALQGRCPHRRMRLCDGRVRGEAIECPYHGWTFSPDGTGTHSASDEHIHAVSYDTVERFGLVWIKKAGSPAEFSALSPENYRFAYALFGTVPVPVELLLDNFTEIEHTGTAHWLFGYPQRHLRDVEFQTTVEANAVRCFSRGPQKRLPVGADRLLGFRQSDRVIIAWTTEGFPLRTTYEYSWEDRESGAVRSTRMFEVAYFLDRGPKESAVAALYWANSPALSVPGVAAAVRWFFGQYVEIEWRRDARVLRGFENAAPGLHGLRLGRFDRALAAQRKMFFRAKEGEG